MTGRLSLFLTQYRSDFPAHPPVKCKADSEVIKIPACHEFLKWNCIEEDLKPNLGHKDADLFSSCEN